MLTGEPLPRSKQPGDEVTGGTVNGQGTLVLDAEAVGAEATLARIIQRVVEARYPGQVHQLAVEVPAGALTRADLDATLDLLDVEGLTAANLAYMRLLMGESLPSDTGEASKN